MLISRALVQGMHVPFVGSSLADLLEENTIREKDSVPEHHFKSQVLLIAQAILHPHHN